MTAAKAIIHLFLLASVTPAIAAPTSLKCNFASGDDITLSLDESQGTVTYIYNETVGKTKRSVSKTQLAQFYPETVLIKYDDLGSLAGLYLRVSRVDLSIQKFWQTGAVSIADSGSCEMYTPKRKF